MSTPISPRKRRPHPARRSRVAAGALSVGATLALVGGMAAGAHAAKSSTTVTTTPASSSGSSYSGSSSGSSSDNGYDNSDDGSSYSSQFNVPAQSGNASSSPATSSHAS